MNPILQRHLLLLAALLTSIHNAPVHAAPVEERIDWPAFLSRHDLVWDNAARAWHEGAFIGNGLLGAMLYSEGSNALQWDVGRSDVTDRGNRLQIGRFIYASTGALGRASMRLDLWNAEASGGWHSPKRDVTWRSFTHATQPVTWIQVNDGQQHGRILFQHLPAVPAREDYEKVPVPDGKMNPEAAFGETSGVQWCRQSFKAGGGYVVAWRTVRSSASETTAFTVDYAPTGTPAEASAIKTIQTATAAGFESSSDTHRQWWHAYWPRSFLSVPDTRLESFYYIQLYKLASATRADKPALDLMGPWFRRTPWPRIWWNLNIQLTYWPVYAANRLDLGESLTRMLDANVGNLISNVPPPWRHDSAAIGRTSSYDCRGGVGGKDGEERGNLTWTLHNYWLQYRHSGDEAMLRTRLYPLLKRAAGYYLHLLKPGADGKLHLPLSLSPEYPVTAPDTNYDLALLRWALQTLLACNDHFALNDPLAATWRDTLSRLTPFPVDEKTGLMIGAGVPLSQSHRHFSHLLMVYPLHVLDPQSPADRPLIERSLQHWIGFEGALQGYSFTGASAISSWLGRRNASVPLLNEFLDRYVKANTMYLEAGPVIETPLAGAAAIHELLLQSWSIDPFSSDLRLFPAVPDDWRDVTIHKMLAEGAFEISASRRDGATRFVQIKSLAGTPCRIRSPWQDLTAEGERRFTLTTVNDKNGQPITTIDLRKGETVLLRSRQMTGDAAAAFIAPVAAQADRVNWYGSRKTPPITTNPDGSITLLAKQARINGTKLLLQKSGGHENIGRWIDAGDYVSWRVHLPADRYKVTATYAATGGGAKFVVRAVDAKDGTVLASTTAERRATGGFNQFQEFDCGTLAIARGERIDIEMRAADAKAPMLNLEALKLTPAR